MIARSIPERSEWDWRLPAFGVRLSKQNQRLF